MSLLQAPLSASTPKESVSAAGEEDSLGSKAPSRTVTMSRIKIDAPASGKGSKYETPSNRGRVMEQFDTPDAQDGVAF